MPKGGAAAPEARARALAEVYRRFGAATAATSPLYERVASALSESDEALRAISAVPARQRRPSVILAVLHDLALAGDAPELAAAYAARDAEAAARAAVDTLRRMADAVAAIAVRRPLRTAETGRYAVLYPAVAEVAYRAGADSVGLIDLNCSAGLDLNVDRVGITYSNGQCLGDRSSPVQASGTVVGRGLLPTRTIPVVVARVGLDRAPVDVTDPGEARWLRAGVWPDDSEEAARLDAELVLAQGAPPVLLPGDVVGRLPDAFDLVPVNALPVVVTTWAMSQVTVDDRLLFLRRLHDAATRRTVAWVSVEGVGVAPAVPTFGDRHASGHSIIGLTLLDHTSMRSEAVGRCWSRGRSLTWLAGL